MQDKLPGIEPELAQLLVKELCETGALDEEHGVIMMFWPEQDTGGVTFSSSGHGLLRDQVAALSAVLDKMAADGLGPEDLPDNFVENLDL